MLSIFSRGKPSQEHNEMLRLIRKEIADPKVAKVFESIVENNAELMATLADSAEQESYLNGLNAAIDSFISSECTEPVQMLQFLEKYRVSLPKNSSGQNIQKSDALNQIATQYPKINVSNLLGIGAVFLAQFQTTAAQQITTPKYFAFTGIPKNGIDTCGSASSCIQGWVEDAMGNVVTQFNRILQVLNGNGNLGVNWQFNNCLDEEKVGSIVIDTLIQAASMTSNATKAIISGCTGKSLVLSGTQAISRVNPANNTFCDLYNNNFEIATTPCIDQGAANGYDWAIAGIILGSICYCACVVVVASLCISFDKPCPH